MARSETLSLLHRVRKIRPVSVPPEQRNLVLAIAKLLGRSPSAHGGEETTFRLVGPGGDSIPLPPTLFRLIERTAELLARGESVAIVPVDEELTTQQAANLLNVSRQYLVRLLDAGEIPCRRTGKHRRVRAADVLDYKARRDRARRAALDELTRLSQEYGGYAELQD